MCNNIKQNAIVFKRSENEAKQIVRLRPILRPIQFHIIFQFISQECVRVKSNADFSNQFLCPSHLRVIKRNLRKNSAGTQRGIGQKQFNNLNSNIRVMI